MVDRLGMHRLDEAQLVRLLGKMRENLAHPMSGLSLPGELENAGSNRKVLLPGSHGGQTLALAYAVGQILSMMLLHARLGIEQVHLGRSTRLEEIDHALGLGGKIREGIPRSGHGLVGKQTGQSGGAQGRCPVA